MRRSSTIRVAFYVVTALLLVFVTFRAFGKDKPISSKGTGKSVLAPEQHANAKNGEVVQIQLEDIIEVPENGVASPEILYKNILNERPFSPVVIFSKSYCGFSKAAKKLLLEDYQLSPPPRVVELDLHPQGSELQAYISEVTGRRTVPNVIVMKQSYGGASEMSALHNDGVLAAKLAEWGGGHLQVSTK
ncbi:Monothiol glutaredoxin-6 [Wickerhamiella sorbophila]|uniref:Monothiol glutaredoxin-6 n=1 Tax=Wickerhamiella sorbophila TaxID=45607 RepID=A0A2T0FDF4_9ASCO|nr:Monothiol glutaredoxin-6 [Wickerhamiella sorbophila]PRT53011.1 Monothiol glutaredoxin-6 [Wickerhamiella sorbophila]